MVSILNREVVVNRTTCRFLGVFISVVLTTLGAFVRIPLGFTPVPLTLQTFFVLLSGALLGRRLGTISQISYLFLGFLGFSIFTGTGSGSFYLLGPTGGYLFGFAAAAFFIGSFIHKASRSFFHTFLLLCLGDFLLLLCGSLWLKIILGLPLSQAFTLGFAPFVPGDIIKACLAAIIFLKLNSRVRQIL